MSTVGFAFSNAFTNSRRYPGANSARHHDINNCFAVSESDCVGGRLASDFSGRVTVSNTDSVTLSHAQI